MRNHCDKLQKALGELIRPELIQHKRAGPFIVLGSETGLQCCSSFYGLTSNKMAIWLRDEIPNWRNGPAMLLNDSLILDDCNECEESAALVLNAVACHELAHCLAFPKLCSDQEQTDSREMDFVPAIIADTKPAAQYEVGDSERKSHGPGFIRILLHVRWRRIHSGWFVPFGDSLDWQRFCSYPGEWVRQALRDEFSRLECMPLSAIQHIPASDEFLKLFEGSADVLQIVG